MGHACLSRPRVMLRVAIPRHSQFLWHTESLHGAVENIFVIVHHVGII